MLFHERLSYHEDFDRRLKTEKKFKIRRLRDFINDLWGFCYRIETLYLVFNETCGKENKDANEEFLHHTSTKLLFPFNC